MRLGHTVGSCCKARLTYDEMMSDAGSVGKREPAGEDASMADSGQCVKLCRSYMGHVRQLSALTEVLSF